MLAMIQADPRYAAGDPMPTSHGLGLAWSLFQLMVHSQAQLSEQFSDADTADQHIWHIAREAEQAQETVDVIWEFNASRDYDPGPDLDRIEAPLLSLNFSDDVINSPRFEVLNRDIQRVRYGRAITIEGAGKARGHQTLAYAEIWREYVAEMLIQPRFRPRT